MKGALCVLFMCLSPVAVGCGSGGAESNSEEASAASSSTRSMPTSVTHARMYKAKSFLGGHVKVVLEDGWTVTEDRSGHLAVAKADDPEHRVMFSLDPYPVRGGKPVENVPAAAPGLFEWLRSNPNLQVGTATQEAVGDALRAEAADVSASDDAVNDDPGCPEAKRLIAGAQLSPE